MVEIPPSLANELKKPLAELISLVDFADLTEAERAAVPPWWLEAASKHGREAVIHALARWEDVLPGLLPKFKSHLSNAGIGIYVGRSDANPFCPMA